MAGLVRDIGHILLAVEDMERALAFYRDLLGFEVLGKADPLWTVVTVPGGQFTLYKQESVIPIALGGEGIGTPFSLHVEDFEKAAEMLEAEGEGVEVQDAHHGVGWDPFATSWSFTTIEKAERYEGSSVTLRAGWLRVQDWLSIRAHRQDLPYLRHALAIEPGLRLLDVGGGTGAYTAVFAAGCQEVVVLEPETRKVAYGERRRPGIQFVAGQAEEIPFPSAHFDRVTAIASFHHVQNPDRALGEIDRVLKPTGRFVLEEFDPTRGQGKRVHIFESIFGGGHSTFYTPSALEAKLQEHGFSELGYEYMGPGYLAVATR